MGGGRANPQKRTSVFFRWQWAQAEIDEEVCVVGDCAELGEWQPCRAIALKKSDRSSCWTSYHAVSLPPCQQVEYKYVICKRATREVVQWEPRDGNRVIVPTGMRFIVEDDDGAFREEDDEDTQSVSVTNLSDSKERARPISPSLFLSDVVEPVDNVLRDRLKELEEQVTKEQIAEPSKNDAVLIAFRLLPLSVERCEEPCGWKVVCNQAVDNLVLSSMLHFTQPEADDHYSFKVSFLGHPGVYVSDENDRRKITQVLAAHNCIPVFVEEHLTKLHLDFCHQFLWPVFHNMKTFEASLTTDSAAAAGALQFFNEAHWKNFQAVNSAYAEAIIAHCSQGTFAWVHDYQLLLVPRYMRLRRPDLAQSFFLHSAFPSAEVLQCFPNREEILQSFLSADVVTFQIFDYARHFLSCCLQLMGSPHSFRHGGLLQVEHERRSVVVATNHFALPYKRLVRMLGEPQVTSRVAATREKFRGKTVIAAYDKCDRFAGLAMKLRIIHKLLLEYPQHKGKIVLVQYLSSALNAGADSGEDVIGELESMAAEINKEFAQSTGEPVVVLEKEDMSQDQVLAVLQSADILLDTSLRDGLNLTPFLFCVAHANAQKGAVIVSEFCGCSCVLPGAYKVNPWDTAKVMRTLDEVLSAVSSGPEARFMKDHLYVSNQSIVNWVTQNISELKGVRQEGHKARTSLVRSGLELKTLSAGLQPLNFDSLLKDYRRAKTRAIFLDNEGTLASKPGWTYAGNHAGVALKKNGHPPDPTILDFLTTLAMDRGNTVVVISGRSPQLLDQWFHNVRGIGLCAEYASHYALPRSLRGKVDNTSENKWIAMPIDQGDDDWKTIVFEVLKQYVKRVQGSILEYKHSSITWNFREVGTPALTNPLALELTRFLDPKDAQGVLHGYPVKVGSGKGYVEVKRIDIDKGVAVRRTMREMQKVISSPIDFVLCIGDDRSDEDMFEVVNAFSGAFGSSPHSPGSRSPKSPVTPMGRRSHSHAFPLRPKSPPSPRMERKTSHSTLRSERSPMKNMLEEESLADLLSNASSCRRQRSSTLVGGNKQGDENIMCYTVTVGRKPSKAKYFVNDVVEVSTLLKKMASLSIGASFSRVSSMPDMGHLGAHWGDLFGRQKSGD